MKVIIIEGLDNTGKTTLINSICETHAGKKIRIIHCEKPDGDTFEEMTVFQNEFFARLTRDIISCKQDKTYDLVVLDRSWYGEYVYGQLYREHDPFDIEMNISMIEDSLKFYFEKNDISFVFLSVDDTRFCVEHDDGLSLSKASVDKIEKEKEMFETIFSFSKIKNKKKIIVNSGLEFRPKQEILDEVLSTIK